MGLNSNSLDFHVAFLTFGNSTSTYNELLDEVYSINAELLVQKLLKINEWLHKEEQISRNFVKTNKNV